MIRAELIGPSWPILERECLSAALTGFASPGTTGAIVTGEDGSGKSTLVSQLLPRLVEGAGPSPVVIRGTDVMAEVPYGALHCLLAGRAADIPRELPGLLGAVSQLIADSAPDGARPLFVVDAAHLLDDSSAHVLAQLAHQGAARAIVVARSLAEVPQPLLDPWREGRFVTVEVPPFTEAEMAEVLGGAVGGPVADATVNAIGTASHWNPLFAQYVVAELRDSGDLAEHEGVWVVGRPVRLSSERVVQLLLARIGRWDEARLRVLEALALTDGLAPHLIEAMADADTLTAMLEDQTLEAGREPGGVIRIRHRLVGDLIRAQLPITKRRRWWQEVSEHGIDEVLTSPEGLLAYAVWTLESGAALDGELAVEAARTANDRFEPELALRLTAHAAGPERARRAATQAARAWRILGEPDRALAALRGVGEPTDPVPEDASFVLEFARSAVHTPNGAAAAWELLERCRPALSGSAAFQNAEWLLLSAELRLTEVIDRLGTWRSPEPPSEQSELGHWLTASCYLLGALALTGRQVDALAIAEEIREAGFRPELDLSDALPSLFMSLLLLGEHDRARAFLPRPSDLGPWQGLYVGNALDTARGFLDLLAGRPGDARPVLLSALGQWMTVDNMSALGLVHDATAMCSAELGDVALAAEHLERATRCRRGPRHLAALSEVFRMRTRLLLGEGEAALADLHRKVGRLLQQGRTTEAFWLWTVGARAGDPACLERLSEGPVPQPAGFASAVVTWATASRSGDTSSLLAAADDLLSCDSPGLAAEAAASALELTRDPGEQAHARVLLATLAAAADDEAPTIFDLLTPRERAVAELAASGQPNREIAETLYLSLRTVESYLSSAYAKLGVSGRRELISLA